MENQKKLKKIEKDIYTLQLRNLRVDSDKAWETSAFRRITICSITYVTAGAVMYAIGVHKVYLNALIPTLGYLLSTLSLPIIKKWWLKSYRK